MKCSHPNPPTQNSSGFLEINYLPIGNFYLLSSYIYGGQVATQSIPMYSWSVCNGTTFTSHRMSKLEISIFCLCCPKPSYYQYFTKLKPNPQPTTKRHRRTKKSGLGRHRKDYTITVDLQTNSLSNRSGQGGDPSTRLLSSGKGAAPPHLEDTAEGG